MSTTVDKTEIAPPETHPELREQRDPAVVRREHLRKLRKRRGRLMLIGIPFAVLALVVAGKFLSMTMIANNTVSSYSDGEYEAALNSAQQQKIVNVVEQWKAPYNTGTVYLQLGLNPEARVELEAALPLASGADQCPIRSNLAIAIERIGDQAATDGDPDAAVTAYQQGLAVLTQAPPECPETTSATPMEETQARLEAKLQPPEGGSDEEDPQEDPSETGDADQDSIDELGDQLGENQDDRQDAIDEDNDEGGGGGGGSDTPW